MIKCEVCGSEDCQGIQNSSKCPDYDKEENPQNK